MNPTEKDDQAGYSTDLSKTPQQPSMAAWQAPQGVSKGTWDYVRRRHIGDRYDAFVSGDPLDTLDRKIINHYLPPLNNMPDAQTSLPPPVVADFGSGTGRTLLPLVTAGYRGVAIDLSLSMLENLVRKNISPERMDQPHGRRGDLLTVQANLPELDGLANDSVDHGVCMLSTLGMIRGRAHRASFLKHAGRIIRPDGLMILHAHNYFYQWRHPGGMKWAAENALAALQRKAEVGDREATYRNVSNMFIHQFRKGELNAALQSSGFTPIAWHGIEAGSSVPVAPQPWHHPFRFVGWVVAAKNTRSRLA